MHWKEAFPWILVFCVVLGVYLYVRSRRFKGK